MFRFLFRCFFFLLAPAILHADEITSPPAPAPVPAVGVQPAEPASPVTPPADGALTPAPAPAAAPAPAPAPAAALADGPLAGKSLALSPAVAGNPQEAFNRALIAYKAGAMDEARRELLAIVESGHLSAALAHNLGNVEFRRGNPGQAVLWYQRALALQPFSPETLQNLRTVRRQTAFLSFDPWVVSLSHLKPRWILIGTMGTAWVLALLVVWLVWLTPRPGRRWPLVGLLALALPLLLSGAALTWRLKTDPHPLTKRQIVSGKETTAYAAPAEASSSVIALPPGSEVVPLETRGNWLYCIIPGGTGNAPLRGWIRAARLEPLWPYPSEF